MKHTTLCLTLILLCVVPCLKAQNCADSTNITAFNYNNKTYEIIFEMKSWPQAAACAAERGGYLVEINSQEEQDSVYDAIVNKALIPIHYTSVPDGGGVAYVWIGGNDIATEGTWTWDGDNDGSGDDFWQGAASGSAVDSAYYNWGGTSGGSTNEPDNYMEQDAAAIALQPWPSGSGHLGTSGEWNDIDTSNALYYIVEKPVEQDTNNTAIAEKIQHGPEWGFYGNTVFISGLGATAIIEVYDITGRKQSHRKCNRQCTIEIARSGLHVIRAVDSNQNRVYTNKVMVY